MTSTIRGWRVRATVPTDAKAIAHVHVTAWRETYRGLMPDSIIDAQTLGHRTAAWQRILAQPSPPLIAHVAEDADGRILGFATGGPARDADCGFSHELTAIYLLRAAQGQGIGRALFEGVVADVGAQAGCSLYAWVLDGNPAAGFYERLGAAPVATRVDERDDHALHEVMFGWRDLRLAPAPWQERHSR